MWKNVIYWRGEFLKQTRYGRTVTKFLNTGQKLYQKQFQK